MHSDFYDDPASEIIRLRDEVNKLRRNEDALKKYARMVTELYTELKGKNKELSAQLGKGTNDPRWISVEEGYPENKSDIYAVVYRPEHIDDDGKHHDAERMVHWGHFRRVNVPEVKIYNRWWTLTERDGTEFVIRNEVSESEYEGGFPSA